MFGYYRLASAVPQLRVADVDYNVDQLMAGFRKAAQQQAAAVVFPELCITGYSCGDLFFQPRLREAALDGLRRFAEATEGSGTIAASISPVSNSSFVLLFSEATMSTVPPSLFGARPASLSSALRIMS